MVQKVKESRDTKLSRASSKMVDAPYALGNLDRGWDCVNSLLSYYGSLGYKFPDEFDGFNRENYAELYCKDQDTGRDVFGRFLESLGSVVPNNRYRPGDLILFRMWGQPIFPGIYLGQANVLIVLGHDKGCKVFPLRMFEQYIYQIRRLI